jgi:hypothetical protein
MYDCGKARVRDARTRLPETRRIVRGIKDLLPNEPWCTCPAGPVRGGGGRPSRLRRLPGTARRLPPPAIPLFRPITKILRIGIAGNETVKTLLLLPSVVKKLQK